MTCKRQGCKKTLNKVTLKHGDPYCSAACCRIEHGVSTIREEQEAERCATMVKDSAYHKSGKNRTINVGRR